MSGNKCFLCSGEIQNGISSSSEENYILLYQILELPDLGKNGTGTGTEEFGGRKISYCRLCLNRILNVGDMLEELERLEKKVLDEKYSIELQLKDKEKSQGQNSSDQLRDQMVTELRAASIGSMLVKIRKKCVGQRRKEPRKIRIMKSVSIPNIASETFQPVSQGQVQTEEVQESQSNLAKQHSFQPNPQSSDLNNDHLESQGENVTNEEPLTASANMTETSWTSDNEELDIKYEILSDSEMIIDPVQPDPAHLDFPQQKHFAVQTSTKLEVDDLPSVTKFSDAQQITTTQDPPGQKNFICGTCRAGFVSYNQLMIHDRVHLKVANYKSSRSKNINRRKGKSGHITKNIMPCMRPRKCEECGKVLSSHQTWTHHVMSFHRRQYKFKCTLCNYGCQKPVHLRVHIKNVHSVHSEDLICSKCDKVCKSRGGLVRHVLKCSVLQQQ